MLRAIEFGDIGPYNWPSTKCLRRYMGTKREAVGGKAEPETAWLSAVGTEVVKVADDLRRSWLRSRSGS